MNQDLRFTRFANGLSSAVLIFAVLACGYVFGKKISSAEAAVGQRSGDTGPGQPGSTKANPDKGLGKAGPAKSNSDSPGEVPAATSKGAVPESLEAVDASNSPPRLNPAEIGRRYSIAAGAGPTGAIEGATVTGDVLLKDSVVAGAADLLEFNATAYCLPGYTAAGIAAHRGTIAADPRILPLGSVVHIRAGGYSGTYLVLDTGAKIKGRKIDIYMPDRREAMKFGRRPIRLKVIGRVTPSHMRPKAQP